MTLLYLDDIYVYPASIDEVLECTKLVFKRLMEFNLKIKQRKFNFFQWSMVFLEYALSAHSTSADPDKVYKAKNWLVPTNQKELHLFWVWHCITTADLLVFHVKDLCETQC